MTISEAELLALVALVNAETAGTNEQIARYGERMTEPDYRAEQRLTLELERRGVLPSQKAEG